MRTCSSGSILSEGRSGTHAEFPSRDGPPFFASQCPEDRLVRASQTESKQLRGHALDHSAVLETMREPWRLMCASGKSIEPCRTCFKRGLMRVVNASILRITRRHQAPVVSVRAAGSVESDPLSPDRGCSQIGINRRSLQSLILP